MKSLVKKLFRAKKSAPDAPPPVEAGPLEVLEPALYVGDLHGRLDLFDRLMTLCQEEGLLSDGCRLVFLGDYVDRGDSSRQVLDWLFRLDSVKDGPVICLKGNHEQMMLDFLDDPKHRARHWFRNGGFQTLASFGLRPPAISASDSTMRDTAQALRDAIGIEMLDWLRNMPSYWVNGNLLAVHAGANPGLPVYLQNEHWLVWGHPQFRRAPRSDGLWVVHGHTIVPEPCVTKMNHICVDTGASATGRLSAALTAPGQEPRFVST